MTPEEHNKTLGTLHLVYGGLHALILLALVAFFLFILGMLASEPGGDPDAGLFFFVIMSVALVFYLIITIPSFVAGYGMLKRKSWAKLWGIIAGVVAGMSFPLGTALCVYSIWFLLSDTGKGLYPETQAQPKRREALYGAPPPAGWAARYASRGRDHEYAPPRQPPDWRG